MRVILKYWKWSIAITAGLIAGLLVMLVLGCLGFAPFGEKVIAVADARIQYLDFFAYLRKVLLGQDSLLFTFAKGLGGSGLALFAYYLASPLNLFVVLFSATNLGLFFNLLFVLKVILAASFFAIFLTWRFQASIKPPHAQVNLSKCIIVILLSIAYGLSQYMLAQSSNTMWLDGVYMLPLMMLGASKLVRNRSGILLAVTTGLTILFNWYAGGINCLFIIIWFGLELALQTVAHHYNIKTIFKVLCHFVISMFLGVLISGILFLPTVLNVLGTGHSSLQIRDLLTPRFVGQFPSALERYTLGADSIYGAVSLFCGSLALLGTIMIFISSKVTRSHKIIFGIFASILLLIFYWQPLVLLFSLLEGVGSYWYRYSYVAIAGLLFMAAYFFCQVSPLNCRVSLSTCQPLPLNHQALSLSTHHTSLPKHSTTILKVGAVCACVLVFIHYCQSTQSTTLVYLTAILILAMAFALFLQSRFQKTSLIFITLIALFELGAETFLIIKRCQEVTATDLANYSNDMISKLDFLAEQDISEYRISQTSPHYISEYRESANFNEPLAYSYKSISSYTSLPKDNQLDLLERLGYRKVYNLNNIITTSILGTDSLLGVKYVFSNYPINGLRALPEQPGIYENPYALPLAFNYQTNDFEIHTSANPFEYQNEIFSKLLGEKVALYRPLTFKLTQKGDVSRDQTQQYQIQIPKGNFAIYGNIPASASNPDLLMRVNHHYTTIYARDIDTNGGSLSPSVFYIPTATNDREATIELTSQTSYHLAANQEQFYALDLDLFAKVVQKIKQQSLVTSIKYDAGKLSATVDAQSGQALFLPVAYDRGWEVKLNSKVIKPELFADALYSIPLEPGANTLEMTYDEPGVTAGIIITGIGIFGVIGMLIWEKHYQSQSKPHKP